MDHQLTYEEMVAAMRADDARYDGKFFICVKTTKIYCIASCKAKRPKLENVIFLPTREEAIKAGFRGCKRCRAEFFPNVQPDWLDGLVTYMKNELQSKIREREIAEHAGVDISTIRRYFKTYMKTTPMAFHRKVRLDHARMLMKRGTNYLTAGYESGFESSSGFREAFVKQFGYAPGRSRGI